MSSREQNERKFGKWRELASGGRCYEFEVVGKQGWKARYFKEVDSSDNTLRFWQEIFNEQNELVEIHQKYPVDLGHRKVR